MELLFYILCGILYSMLVVLGIILFIGFMYAYFKFAFWIFDVLGLPNPIITAYETIRNCIKIKSK